MSNFTIRRRTRRARVEWQVWRGRILGRCETEEAAQKLMRYFVAEEARTRAVLVARRDALAKIGLA